MLADVTLIVLSVVLIGDLLLQLKELCEERIVLGSRRQGNWRLWDKLWHFSNGNGHGSKVVKLDEILLLLDGLGRIERDVHDCA